MIPGPLSNLWVWLTPAAANHIWQSTVFALAAGMLTLLLRRNQARARYWLWLAASIKFLVPFALLMALGSSLAPPRAPAAAPAGYSYAAEISQPFNQFMLPETTPAAAQHLGFAALLPAALLAIWLIGFLAVAACWFLRWGRICAIARQALPIDAGREVEALRRLERLNKIRSPIPLRMSAASLGTGILEPGIFGIFRPVLLWPEGISAHLNDAHLDAILAHELRHVRHHDNLAATMHAVIQAVFWFHPLVWWMGAQLVQERERGCDEEVIEMGSQPGVYAEGILKACEFCVASPLASFSGVTGADLKQRIVRIMSGASGHRLTSGKKRLILAAGAAAFAAPLVFGLVNIPLVRAQLLAGHSGPLPSFEVVSVKPSAADHHADARFGRSPGRFTTENMRLVDIIRFAYNGQSNSQILPADQLLGAPNWVSSAKYDIEAKEDDATARKLEELSPDKRVDQIRWMVQSLLATRFHLTVSRQTKELPVYALVIAKGGSKLKLAAPPAPSPAGSKAKLAGTILSVGPGNVQGINWPVAVLANILAHAPEVGERVVLDETGLKGRYNWTLNWTPQNLSFQPAREDGGQSTPVSAPPSGGSGPSLFTALEEQLGLKLVPQRGPVEVLVIDHVERPSPN